MATCPVVCKCWSANCPLSTITIQADTHSLTDSTDPLGGGVGVGVAGNAEEVRPVLTLEKPTLQEPLGTTMRKCRVVGIKLSWSEGSVGSPAGGPALSLSCLGATSVTQQLHHSFTFHSLLKPRGLISPQPTKTALAKGPSGHLVTGPDGHFASPACFSRPAAPPLPAQALPRCPTPARSLQELPA